MRHITQTWATHITVAARHCDLLEIVAVGVQTYDPCDVNNTCFACDGLYTVQTAQPGRAVYPATGKEREISPPGKRGNHATQKVCLRVGLTQRERGLRGG